MKVGTRVKTPANRIGIVRSEPNSQDNVLVDWADGCSHMFYAPSLTVTDEATTWNMKWGTKVRDSDGRIGEVRTSDIGPAVDVEWSTGDYEVCLVSSLTVIDDAPSAPVKPAAVQVSKVRGYRGLTIHCCDAGQAKIEELESDVRELRRELVNQKVEHRRVLDKQRQLTSRLADAVTPQWLKR